MSWVYFLRPIGLEGPVKIGCSRAAEDRLALFSAWTPFPTEIAARIRGDAELERRFHHLFRHLHQHREWFRAAPELTNTISAIANGQFDASSLPLPRGLPVPVRKPWSPEQRLAVRMRRALERAERDGLKIPAHIEQASKRYGAGRYAKDYDPHNPADAKLILDFLGETEGSLMREAA